MPRRPAAASGRRGLAAPGGAGKASGRAFPGWCRIRRFRGAPPPAQPAIPGLTNTARAGASRRSEPIVPRPEAAIVRERYHGQTLADGRISDWLYKTLNTDTGAARNQMKVMSSYQVKQAGLKRPKAAAPDHPTRPVDGGPMLRDYSKKRGAAYVQSSCVFCQPDAGGGFRGVLPGDYLVADAWPDRRMRRHPGDGRLAADRDRVLVPPRRSRLARPDLDREVALG